MIVIDEDTMVRLMGTDYCFYMRFLRQQAWMFLLLFVINFTVLVPVYYSGSDG